MDLLREEKEYLQKHQIIIDEVTSDKNEKSGASRFTDAYIELSNKETEEVVKVESASFLQTSVQYLKEHKELFLYVESKWFELIGVDAVSLEVDDVFGTYDVLLGLKLQRKYSEKLKTYLNKYLGEDTTSYDLMFNQNDGVWDLNFTLENLHEFKNDMSLEDAYILIYRFLFKLIVYVEES